jgi:hypothetical protein
LCAQSPGVFVNIGWNLKYPNPVRVKTSSTLTHLTVTSGQDLVLPQWLAVAAVRSCVQCLLA